MIHFIPDRVIPDRVSGIKRRYLNECISLFLVLAFGVIYSFVGGNAADGLWPKSFEKLRFLLHGGVFMCPLCGGTRSFLFMCRGEIITAAHYNFFAIVFFFSLPLHVFLKMWFLCTGKLPGFAAEILKFIDRNSLLLIIIFALWPLQLLLHYTGVFIWYSAV